MMYKHYVLLSSSYSCGTRIGFHVVFEGTLDMNRISGILEQLKTSDDELLPISTHYITTESKDWKSICEKDSFFEDVFLYDEIEEFREAIMQDQTLEGLDIARYILSKRESTQLELQKLVYLAYEDYLCIHDKKMYKDINYAFQYGPVVQTVYDKYKGMGKVDRSTILPQQAMSRLLFAQDGIKILGSIDKILDRYGSYSGSELVDLTHRIGGPWEKSYHVGSFHEVIDDNTIKRCHKEIAS